LSEYKQAADPLLSPFELRGLKLRNRIMSTAHAPSYVENGWPTDRYRLYHEEKAKGGIALTVIGGSTNVSPDSPSAFGQIYAGDDSVIPWFERLTTGVKAHGAAVMCQLTHMGRRTLDDVANWLPVVGPSNTRERAHRSYPKAMEKADILRVTRNFAEAAKRCQKGGFDGIELLSHSHLLGQFLSPHINKRDDAYGGCLENRLRLVREVLDAVRQAVGGDLIVGMRITGSEFLEDGLAFDECVEIATQLETTGQVDFLNILAGAPYDDLGLAEWIPPMGGPPARSTDVVKGIRAAVSLPVFHAGGIADLATARHVLRDGVVDMVGMTRAHIADPHIVNKLITGREERIRVCVGMNYCVDRVNQGKDALCGQNAATGREEKLSHSLIPVAHPGKAVVVGGGPGGMEAARVLAEQGHNVVLFEASSNLGGQVLMAAAGTTRRQIGAVTHWLAAELDHLKVDIRYNVLAEASDVMAEQPDLVVIATGGLPRSLEVPGGELGEPIWNLFSEAPPSGRVMIFDDRGDHQTAVAAEVAAATSGSVAIVTPDRTPLHNLGPTNYAVVMRALYKLGVSVKPDLELISLRRDGNSISVKLRNVLSGEFEDHQVDRLFYEVGTEENAQVYFDLVESSWNGGQFDMPSMIEGKLNFPETNPEGGFLLVRVGDAVSSRNVHAALYDAMRICSGINLRIAKSAWEAA
jgi:2,4-dienoyl-CoA reductase-like NADH-dependent reductase (Old Yellow Enzyme family)/thioredoxin reductase